METSLIDSLSIILVKIAFFLVLGGLAVWQVIKRFRKENKNNSTPVLFSYSYRSYRTDERKSFRKLIGREKKNKVSKTKYIPASNIDNASLNPAIAPSIESIANPANSPDEISAPRSPISTHPNTYTDYLLYDIKNDTAILKKPGGGSWQHQISLQELADRPSMLNKKVGKIVRLAQTKNQKFDVKVKAASKKEQEPIRTRVKERQLH